MYPPPYQQQKKSEPAEVQEEIRLFDNAQERQRLDDMAELYVIIKATQHLEKSFIRDCVSSQEYTDACQRLIAQFKTTETALKKNNVIDDTMKFAQKYKMDCSLGLERLLTAGVPATVVHAHTDSSKDMAVIIVEATQWFITAMDALKLDQRAVDEIQPLIKDLVNTLNKMTTITQRFDQSSLQNWLVTLNEMRAVDELDDEQARQLSFDLETAYHNFMAALKDSGGH